VREVYIDPDTNIPRWREKSVPNPEWETASYEIIWGVPRPMTFWGWVRLYCTRAWWRIRRPHWKLVILD